MNSALEKRLALLEEASRPGVAGPSLILITALGRDADEVRGVRLPSGLELRRLSSESATDFRQRAASWAAASGSSLVKLGTAIYDTNSEMETHL